MLRLIAETLRYEADALEQMSNSTDAKKKRQDADEIDQVAKHKEPLEGPIFLPEWEDQPA